MKIAYLDLLYSTQWVNLLKSWCVSLLTDSIANREGQMSTEPLMLRTVEIDNIWTCRLQNIILELQIKVIIHLTDMVYSALFLNQISKINILFPSHSYLRIEVTED